MDSGAASYRRFLDGDNEGFVEIVRVYNDGLILYLNSFVNNISIADIADELAEDAFVKLGVKKPRYAGKSSFKTWLYAIGRNVAMDYIRKKAKERTVPLDACAEQTDEELLESRYIKEERKIILHRAMNNLKPEYRQVLWLIYFEGFSNKEVAKIMRKSVHAVESLASRARQSLRTKLNEEGFVYENL